MRFLLKTHASLQVLGEDLEDEDKLVDKIRGEVERRVLDSDIKASTDSARKFSWRANPSERSNLP